MSPRYLLDTNIVSEPVRPRPDRGIAERLSAHQHQLAVAAPAWQELLFGLRRLPPSERRRTLERYLTDSVAALMPILPYDQAAAEWHAAERARLVGVGKTPPFVDGQIAAVAHVNGLVLVTANVADFAHFADLQLEDWRS